MRELKTDNRPRRRPWRNAYGVYGRVRIIEGLNGVERMYVKRTNVQTYVLSTSERLTLDSMVAGGGEYHFSTLRHLASALERATS